MASKKSLHRFLTGVWRARQIRSFGALPEGSASSESSQHLINLEYQCSAHNYHPIPVVFSQAKGSSIWDPEGNKYVDFLSAYSAVNQGHCHPKIMKALVEQAQKLTLSSRAFYNDRFPVFAERLTSMFGYDMVLPMNTGAEGVETALKLARKWGYLKKKIPRTRKGDQIAGFLFEPIQGEAGYVIIPPDGYLQAVRDLCSKYNILMIADEIQSGLARSGRMLACDWENVRPDVVILGKALGGGVLPVSAVLADNDVMLCIQPGEHGSTFGGNALASAVAIASLDVIRDERLAEREQLVKVQQQFPNLIKEVRGKGLFNAVELNSKALSPVTAYDICLRLKERGVLAKPTHDSIIRLTPPLSISLDELHEGSKALQAVLELDLSKMKKEKPDNTTSHAAADACDRCGRNLYAS
ncbi:Ornithine aminotransferase, mitochondrial [Sesamum angolense]|uniref:Ornithine aminotransferase n=1 Tax=Sesamum angolense TaxID=2727404 RepID=A0AAE1WU78_9LAMI|nr:Ornithine aminotransferase, mitochondrial [Sesamum angolense]